jgi:enoyl-CoA hydratase/carnithine racemase
MEFGAEDRYFASRQKKRFDELFIKRSLCRDVPGNGRLAQLFGRGNAAELPLTGDIIDANRALQIRLVSRVFPCDELPSTAKELARKIASNPAKPKVTTDSEG